MKSIVYILLLCTIILHASDSEETKRQIFQKIAQIVSNRQTPTLCLLQKDTIHKCRQPDVLFTDHEPLSIQPKETACIALSYALYRSHKEEFAGAFFWQKGRPTIILNEQWLKLHHRTIPPDYHRYLE